MGGSVRRLLFAFVLLGLLGFLIIHFGYGWDFSEIQTVTSNYWRGFSGIVDWIYDRIDHVARFLAPVVTILGGGYAIAHKWNYNRSRMRVHIDEFIKRENDRLRGSRAKLAKTLERPGPERSFGSPVFRRATLQPALGRMNWDYLKWGKFKWSPMARADHNLEDELTELEDQLKAWGNVETNYNERRAQVHLLRGAIAAARAARAKLSKNDAWAETLRALKHFEAAHELNSEDPEALEYMAYMRVRLGQHELAIAAFENLANLAPKDVERSSLRSRALKCQAEVNECKTPPSLQRANGLLRDALACLPENDPPMDRAELHEMQGRVRKQIGPDHIYLPAATGSYTDAAELYQRIIDENIRDGDARNISKAKAGLSRCREEIEKIARRLAEVGDSGQSAAH
jgi:tetratricopeptide (TPR) repeat protein